MAIGEVGEINVKITADTGSLERGVKRADSSLDRLRGRMANAERAALKFGAATGTAAAVAGGIKLVQVARQADILRASLRTATGSTEAAAEAFRALEGFAARTPFALEQSVEAFIKLKNLGLDPSERALESYGNTAAAMGKSMNQMIEAVADASTMEFERLKEFGIKARQQADTVSFTFRGVTTTVAKNSKDIQEFLLSIGETNFAGAMAERAATLDGAISNLEDSFNSLFRAIGDRGATDVIANAFRDASEALNEFTLQIQSGEIEERLAALGGLFDGWADDIESAFGDAANAVSDETGSALDDLASAMSDLPENIRAMVQLMGVELSVIGDRAEAVAETVVQVFAVKLAGLADKARIVGKAIAHSLNPFATGAGPDLEAEFARIDALTADMADGYFKAAESRIEASRNARLQSILDILAERDAAQKAYADRVAFAKQMTEELRKENEKGFSLPAAEGGEDSAEGGGDEKLRAQLEALRARFDTEARLTEEFNAQMVALDKLKSSGLLKSEEEYRQLKEQIILADQEKMRDLRDKFNNEDMELMKTQQQQLVEHFSELFNIGSQGYDALNRVAKKHWDTETQMMAGAMLSMVGSLSTNSRKMFEIQKKAGIANAIVSTYQGAAKALELGFPVGPIAALAIIANGFAKVNSIRSQSFNGGGGVGAGGGGPTSVAGLGVGQGATPQVGESAATGQAPRRVLVEGIDPSALISGRQLIEILNEAQQDGPALITVSR